MKEIEQVPAMISSNAPHCVLLPHTQQIYRKKKRKERTKIPKIAD